MNAPVLRFKDDTGQLFPDWNEKQLGSIATFSKGKGISKADIDANGATLCIRYGELYTEYGETIRHVKSKTNIAVKNLVLSEVNDVIIPASGETQIDIATASCVQLSGVALGGDLNIIKTAENGVYLSYYLNSQKKLDIAKLAQGNSVVHLYSSQLKQLDVKLPSLPEQAKIANFLNAVDEKITQLTQKHELLTQYKKGVMQQIFSQELRFKDDNGQDFPEWEVNTLEGVSINYYQGINTAADKVEYVEDGTPIIQAKHITGEYLDFSDARGLNESDYEKYKEKYNPKINDLLISNIGTLGKVVLVESDLNFLIAWNIFKVTLDTKICYPRYIREYLKKISTDGYFDSIKTGNATKFINKSDMLAIEISFPSLNEQTKIANFLTAIDNKITATQTQLQAVKQYKQGLLQQMFV